MCSLEEQRLEAVQYADLAVRGTETAFGLDTDELCGRVDEAREGPRRVAAPVDADDVIRSRSNRCMINTPGETVQDS